VSACVHKHSRNWMNYTFMKQIASFRITHYVYQQILPPHVNAVACICVVFIYNSIMFCLVKKFQFHHCTYEAACGTA